MYKHLEAAHMRLLIDPKAYLVIWCNGFHDYRILRKQKQNNHHRYLEERYCSLSEEYRTVSTGKFWVLVDIDRSIEYNDQLLNRCSASYEQVEELRLVESVKLVLTNDQFSSINLDQLFPPSTESTTRDFAADHRCADLETHESIDSFLFSV